MKSVIGTILAGALAGALAFALVYLSGCFRPKQIEETRDVNVEVIA